MHCGLLRGRGADGSLPCCPILLPVPAGLACSGESRGALCVLGLLAWCWEGVEGFALDVSSCTSTAAKLISQLHPGAGQYPQSVLPACWGVPCSSREPSAVMLFVFKVTLQYVKDNSSKYLVYSQTKCGVRKSSHFAALVGGQIHRGHTKKSL